MTDQEFTRHALDVLPRELGPDGLARLLRLNRSGTGDYTRDREQWQKDPTLDESWSPFGSIARNNLPELFVRQICQKLPRNLMNSRLCARVLNASTTAAES